MGLNDSQNPGVGGINELTTSEETFVQGLAALSYAQGDILYHNGTVLTRLAVGTNGQFLKTQGAGANPVWADISGANTALSNLAAVAINTTLVSDTDNTDDLGTISVFWRTGYFKTSIELGATDTTITRVSAGLIAVEGVTVVDVSTAQTLSNKTFVAPVLGAATATSINGLTITTSTGTLTITNGKTISFSQTLTFAGTDGTTMTFPTTSASVARTDAGQTFTGVNVFTSPKIITDISDTNGNELFKFTATGSAVNEFTVINAATGNPVQLQATGGDTDIGITLAPKGAGIVKGELKRFMVRLLGNTTDTAIATLISGDYRISNRAITVKAVGAYVDTAGTTNLTTVDINEAGTTILSTKITIDSTEKSSETAATPPVISDSAIAADAIVTFDIDAIQTTAAKGLVVWIDYVYA